MIQQDTIKLLRECDAGVKMGIASIDDVIDRVKQKEMRTLLHDCKKEHEELHDKIQKKHNILYLRYNPLPKNFFVV